MDTETLRLLGLIGLPVLLLLYLIIAKLRSYTRLSSFPGPPLATISYAWLMRTSMSGRMFSIYHDTSKKYGPIARIGPNELLITDPALIRRMSGARSQYKRSRWYKPWSLDPYHDSMFSVTDTAAHDKMKARLASGYGGKDIPGLEGDVDRVLMELVSKIRDKYAVGGGHQPGRSYTKMDLALMSSYFTLDTMSAVAFGKQLGFLTHEEDVGDYLKNTEKVVPVTNTIAEVPWLTDLVLQPWMIAMFGPKATDKSGVGRIMGIAKEMVADRYGPDAKERPDMLGSFVRKGLTKRESETEAILQIIAGSDTTATAIRSTMLQIITNPRVYLSLQAEIDQAAPHVSTPISLAEAEKLPYLQSVISEGLRMHPPATGLQMKEVPPEGDTLADGRFVPGGTRMGWNIWGITRDTAVFGPDAETFRPERFLEADEATRIDMKRGAEMVFGSGRWGCAGKPIAFMELNKVFFELLRNFDFQLVDPANPWTSMNVNLFFQRNMWVVVTDRVN